MDLQHDLQWPTHCISTNEINAMELRKAVETCGKTGQKIGIGLWKCEGERGPGRLGPHSGHIAEIDRQGLVANRLRGGFGRKMPPEDHGVHTDRQLHPERDLQERRIIANTQHHIASPGASAEILFNDAELG